MAGAARGQDRRRAAQHPWPGYAVRVVDLVPMGDGSFLPVVALEPPR